MQSFSTVGINLMHMNQFRTIESKIVDASKRSFLMSDDKSRLLTDFGRSLKSELLMRNTVKLNESYINSNDVKLGVFEQMDIAIDNLLSNAREFSYSILSYINSNQDEKTIREHISKIKEAVVESLNVKFRESFLFGGTDTKNPPVKVDFNNVREEYDTENFEYYNGTDNAVKYNVSLDREISYKINAGDRRIEKLFRAFDVFINTEVNQTNLDKAYGLVNESINGINDMKIELAIVTKSVSDAKKFLEESNNKIVNELSDRYKMQDQYQTVLSMETYNNNLELSVGLNKKMDDSMRAILNK